MTKYEKIAMVLQERVDNGELTLEDANRLNDLAYEKYVNVEEAADDTNKDLELLDQLRELVEAGKVKLGKEDVKCIKELIGGAEEAADDKKEEPAEEENKEEKPEEVEQTAETEE